MINKILDKMIKRGFVDSYGDIYDINENDDNFVRSDCGKHGF